ncbi:hypothetical protein BKH43_08275 [Helicobacter sp. 13S00401-1]|uniref:hypothetical protein n=1 Tax=Helicobacter sp. 13S00401-1 TaxID=1905758 RepID=UPI000BA77D7D|nr:hypothetical protein [Helicobacter sp. 13S00401-1]PAF47027.1 hypothetical protein BKH43_08275 [Helicobacter sp. 13S00401-1]
MKIVIKNADVRTLKAIEGLKFLSPKLKIETDSYPIETAPSMMLAREMFEALPLEDQKKIKTEMLKDCGLDASHTN